MNIKSLNEQSNILRQMADILDKVAIYLEENPDEEMIQKLMDEYVKNALEMRKHQEYWSEM